MTSTEIPPEFLKACVHLAYKRVQGTTLPLSEQILVDESWEIKSSPHSVSKLEARRYCAGLPSNPILVYRTGATPWKKPTGPEAYRVFKEVKPVFSHDIVAVWGDLGPKVCSCLDSFQVTWTSVDVVRFAEVGEKPGPTVLWIGVMPRSLSGEDAHTAAVSCQKLLDSYKITDIEVEFRECVFTRSVGPKLLKSVCSSNATAGIRGPLTPALGLQIAARDMPYTEGTGGLYISEGGNSDKVYILSARHVLFPRNAENDKLYTNVRVWNRRQVLIPGLKAFQMFLGSTMEKIGSLKTTIDLDKRSLDRWKDGGDVEERTKLEGELKEAEKAIKVLDQFHSETTKCWSEESQRVLGHIAYSPPITVCTGAEGYTEDWALIELDRDKIDWNTFKGNVIDLGTETSMYEFIRRMLPESTGRKVRTSFIYPLDRLLPLQGIIKEDELLRPQMFDADGERSLIVIKNGCATGVTIGRATGAKSFVREYFPDGSQETSMEWAILPYDKKSRAFSAPGDSGATIVDKKGRIGGLLTGGTGQKESIDITYASPFYWLWQRIQTHFPNAHPYPLTADQKNDIGDDL